MRRAKLFFVLAVAMLAGLFLVVPLSIAQNSPPSGPYRTFAPYFQVAKGFSTSVIVRNNHASAPATVTPVLFTLDGQQLRLATIELRPDDARTFDLGQAIVLAGVNADTGAIGLEFVGGQPTSVGGMVAVKDVQRSLIFTFPFRPGYGNSGSRVFYSPWWLRGEEERGTLVLFNASNESVTLHPSVAVNGRWQDVSSFALLPFQSRQLKLRQFLVENRIRGTELGLIRLAYDGPVAALHPALFFFDEDAGYSAASSFSLEQPAAASQLTSLYAPSVLINAPYPSMGFDPNIRVTPYGVFANTTEQPLQVELKAYFYVHGQSTPQSSVLPLAPLGPLETRWIDFSTFVQQGLIPTTAAQISLELKYPGASSGLVARVFSMDPTRNYVFTAELTRAAARNDVAYWNIEGNEFSVTAIQNVSDEEVGVRVTLQYDQGTGAYKLPLLKIPPRGTRNVNIKQILQSGAPDEDGSQVPAGVIFGTVRIERADGLRKPDLAIVGAMYDPVAGMCGEHPLPCIGVQYTWMVADPTTGFVGGFSSVSHLAYWSDSTVTLENWQTSFSSTNPSSIGVSESGWIDFLQPGNSYIDAYAFMPRHPLEDPYCAPILFAVVALAVADPPPTVSQSPSFLNMSTGDTNKQITVTIEPNNQTVSTSFSVTLNLNPDSSCAVAPNIPGQQGAGTLNHTVSAAPAGCSGIFTVRASASGTESTNTPALRVPPQILIRMIFAEAGGQDGSNDTSQEAVGVTMRNRLGDSAFSACSNTNATYQSCLSSGVVLAGITTGPQPELDKAVGVFTRQVGDIVFGSQCFWTPTAAEWAVVQQAIQSGTAQFPQNTGSPSCFSQDNRQIVRVGSVGMHVDGRGAPAFLFIRTRASTDPAAVSF